MSTYNSNWIERNIYYKEVPNPDEPDTVKYQKYFRPVIVCLCGSTRFWKEFQEASLRETLEGRIVLSIGAARSADDHDKTFGGYVPVDQFDRIKAELDELHCRKIDLADEILVLNVGGYIGDSTNREISYAFKHHKRIRYLEPIGYTDVDVGGKKER